MSHFLDRLTYFRKYAGTFSNGHGETTTESRAWEESYRSRWLHPRRQLHRLLLLEDLRQGRDRHLGDAADRLPAHAPRSAQP